MSRWQGRTGARRVALLGGTAAVAAVLSSGAIIRQAHDVQIGIDGRSNTFSIEVAGSSDPAWTPSSSDWIKGGSTVSINPLAGTRELIPGRSLAIQVAVRNTSPTLAGDLRLTIVDPDPRGPGGLDLFDELVFTVQEGSRTVRTGSAGQIGEVLLGAGPTRPGDTRRATLTITLPESFTEVSAHDRTGLEIRLHGESA